MESSWFSNEEMPVWAPGQLNCLSWNRFEMLPIAGMLAYGAISIGIYWLTGREIRCRGFGRARLGLVVILGGLACALVSCGLLLLSGG